MTDLLRRNLAPLTDEAWAMLDQEAKLILEPALSGRRIVDFSGPHGWEHGCVNLGRLDLSDKEPSPGVTYGIRQNLPLVEARVPFTLNQMELDAISRGAEDPNLDALEEAAHKVVHFEEKAIYEGFKDGHIAGICSASPHKGIKLGDDIANVQVAVAEAEKLLHKAGIHGPYALVLGVDRYLELKRSIDEGYPPARVVNDLIEGPLSWTTAIKGGVLLATRGGDFELTVGQDIAIGYASHDRESVELYFVESFTFRPIEPAAAVPLK